MKATIGHWRRGIAAMLFLLSAAVVADEVMIFESCVDSRGQSLPTVADYRQPMLVRTLADDGETTIRYNPEVLPQLTPAARLFFYAGQCARDGRHGVEISSAQARQADCIGVDALLAGGLLRRDELPALQAELAALGDTEWTQLPGPRRDLTLTACPPAGRGVLRMPLADTPSAREIARNDCVRACADRLWHCRKSCRGEACTRCQSTYELCDAACGDGTQ